MALEVLEKKSRFAIIGLGTFGMNLATSLVEEGGEAIVIDRDRVLIEKIKDKPVFPYVLDSTSEEALIEAGIESVDCAIVCIGVDLVASVLTTLLLKKFKIPRILARATTDEHAQILRMIGVNEVIQPELDISSKIARKLVSQTGYLLNYEQLSKDYAIVEIRVNKKLADRSLVEIDLRKNYRINVIALKSIVERLDDDFRNINDFEINEVPDPNTPLRDGDILIVMGRLENIKKLNEFLMGA